MVIVRSRQVLRKILNLLLVSLFVLVVAPSAQAQEGPCSKPRVEVRSDPLDEKVVDRLNEHYSQNSPKDGSWWELNIHEKVMEQLHERSAGTVFIPAPCDNCDYYFRYIMGLSGTGEDLETEDGLLMHQYRAYAIFTRLAELDPCKFPGKILEIEITRDDRDLNYTIMRNMALWGDIGERIREHEDSHPVPPRGPKLKTSQNREFVSPLKDERELDIKIDVTNCKGEVVYEETHGQRVILPRETDRAELKATPGFPQGHPEVSGNELYLFIIRPVGASATYTLKRGIKADRETVTVKTCGRDSKEINEEEIEIHGLDLEVTPDRKRISTGDRTDIWIKLSRVDPDGNKIPVPWKTIQLDIRGLVDGSVKSPSKYITDGNGEVLLVYASGEHDKSVTFDAKFQPVDYPEFVSDKATIAVTKPYWQGTLHYWEKESYACSFKATEATEWRYHEEKTDISEIGTINFRYEDPYLNVDETATTTGSSDYKRHFFRDAGVKARCEILINKHWDDHTCREQIEPGDLNFGIPSDLPKNPGTYPIKVSVTLKRTCKSKWTIDSYSEERWPCENDHPPDVRDPPPETVSSTHRLGFHETLKGTLTVKRDGTRQISASMNHAYDVPGDNYTDIGGPQCPPYKRAINVSIQMTGGY